MNDSTEKLFRIRMRKLANVMFYMGLGFFIIALGLVIIEFYSNLQLLYMGLALGVLTSFMFGGWIGIFTVQRAYRVLDALDRTKTTATTQ
jgi:magnesium-transporting ATPase (P-type)